MKTFIRWQGNKSKYLKHLKKVIPNDIIQDIEDGNITYIEPFLGSGALFLDLQPERWIITDINKDNINIWKSIKENPYKIISEFKKFGKSFKIKTRENKIKFCKEKTKEIDKLPYNFNRASQFLLMKFCVYMGNIIVNNKFVFNGLDLNIDNLNTYSFLKQKYYDLLKQISEYLNESNGKIYNKDYKLILSKAKKGDFVFLDPPYFEKHSYQFNYNKDETIDLKFLKDLKTELINLDKKGIKWIMTYANTEEVKDVFKSFIIKKFKVFRRASMKSTYELIILSNTLIDSANIDIDEI
jgi:DNA adenine methylase